MPTISVFYGINISIFKEINSKHNLPHFHAYYNEYQCTVDINTAEIIKGKMPSKQKKLILAWAVLRKKELISNWNSINSNGKSTKIEPLF